MLFVLILLSHSSSGCFFILLIIFKDYLSLSKLTYFDGTLISKFRVINSFDIFFTDKRCNLFRIEFETNCLLLFYRRPIIICKGLCFFRFTFGPKVSVLLLFFYFFKLFFEGTIMSLKMIVSMTGHGLRIIFYIWIN